MFLNQTTGDMDELYMGGGHRPLLCTSVPSSVLFSPVSLKEVIHLGEMSFPPHCLGRVHLPLTHCSGEKVPFRVEGGHHLQGVASDPDTTLRFRSSVNGVNACTYVE